MNRATPRRRVARRLLLALVATACALALGEGFARWRWPLPDGPTASLPIRLCGDCPQVYELDPDHPEINPLGTRGPDRRDRWGLAGSAVAVLGDSVTYGFGVTAEEAFPRQLQLSLEASGVAVRTENAGVPGYGTYNELQWYRAHARELRAGDAVLVVCLNDIVDPLLHWAFLGDGRWSSILDTNELIPARAIPDPDYHVDHVLAPLRANRGWHLARDRSGLLRRFGPTRRWSGPLGTAARPHRRVATVDGRSWPVELTIEDELPIQTWLDPDTPRWRWFEGALRALAQRFEGRDALLVAVMPLAYQLDTNYPFAPQDAIAELCAAEGIPYVDLRDALRPLGAEIAFLPGDLWHLSPSGHRAVGAALREPVQRWLIDDADNSAGSFAPEAIAGPGSSLSASPGTAPPSARRGSPAP